MNFLYSDGPIIASSSCNHANAALAVIRISGFANLDQFLAFFTHRGPIEPRRVYYTSLVFRGAKLDDCCLTYFPGPHSYNGENILELSVHGNVLNVERIIQLFVEHGNCQVARPGEFTYRALKNKKLDLSQVEGLDLFLNANSGYALDEGLSLLSGNLHELYTGLYDSFLKHKSSLELMIDFSDDVGDEAAKGIFKSTLYDFKSKIEALNRRVSPMSASLVEPEIILAGLPNSGKSSLFNHLLREDRSIVSAIAGTTRDYITEHLVIDGVKYKLIDTAGVREAGDLIEAEGIKRTKKKIHQCFFSVLLINPFEIDLSIKELLNFKFDIIVFTHSDLPGFSEAKAKLQDRYPELGSIGAVSLISAAFEFEEDLCASVNKKYLNLASSKPILLDRHKYLIEDIYNRFCVYEKSTTYEQDVAILSDELNATGHCLSELIGIISPDQVLNSIFSNFCIGK